MLELPSGIACEHPNLVMLLHSSMFRSRSGCAIDCFGLDRKRRHDVVVLAATVSVVETATENYFGAVFRDL